MSALRVLGLAYLVSASIFAMAASFAAHPWLSPLLKEQTITVAGNFQQMVWKPAVGFARREESLFFHQQPRAIAAAPQQHMGRAVQWTRPAVARHELTGETAPQFIALADKIVLPDLPDIAPADQTVSRDQVAPPLATGDAPLSAPEREAASRLKASLSDEMLKSFDLFLYVSKADKGPLAQRLYVFRKRPDNQLTLLYDWAASTGRERSEITPLGTHDVTDTPRGYYELDPNRMYRRYHSHAWDQAMPYSMFFNWQQDGLTTGLAIHGASGADVARLGHRASAGCVHIDPENAKLLYHLIRTAYNGPAPRFAYDRRTASSSNGGDFQHDAGSRLEMAEGYKVLIFIEDYGGGNVVAALF